MDLHELEVKSCDAAKKRNGWAQPPHLAPSDAKFPEKPSVWRFISFLK